MVVAVEGIVLNVERKEKEEKGYDKVFTDVQLHQEGERELVTCRLDGDREQDFDKYQKVEFKGRLLLWKQREGVGKMILVEEILS